LGETLSTRAPGTGLSGFTALGEILKVRDPGT
jgi:hypothetical protein